MSLYVAKQDMNRTFEYDFNKPWRDATRDVIVEIIFVFSVLIVSIVLVYGGKMLYNKIMERKTRIYDGTQSYEVRVLEAIGKYDNKNEEDRLEIMNEWDDSMPDPVD